MAWLVTERGTTSDCSFVSLARSSPPFFHTETEVAFSRKGWVEGGTGQCYKEQFRLTEQLMRGALTKMCAHRLNLLGLTDEL